MNDIDQYCEFVRGKKKHPKDIISEMNPGKADMLHMAVGVSKEAGELLDAIARVAFYNKPVDRENVVEELGDLEFFMEGIRQRLHISREETISHNAKKLGARYASGSFSNEQANARADKENGQ